MNYSVIKPLAVIMLLAGFSMGSAHAREKVSNGGSKPQTTKTKKKSGHSGQIKFIPGSAETTKERSTRLKGECKGRVNAGACAGYTN